jgi:hypothetical protein
LISFNGGRHVESSALASPDDSSEDVEPSMLASTDGSTQDVEPSSLASADGWNQLRDGSSRAIRRKFCHIEAILASSDIRRWLLVMVFGVG